MGKSSSTPKYIEWLNSDVKKRVIENIRKSGFPLELKVRKTLLDNGYRVNNARYLDPGNDDFSTQVMLGHGVWREIDLLAVRRGNATVNINNFQIDFVTNILCECKYSSDKDIIVFEHLNPTISDVRRFPVLVNGHGLLPYNFQEQYKLPLRVERLIQVNANSITKEKGNYDDAEIHTASEQILAALRFFVDQKRRALRNLYLDTNRTSSLWKIWQTLVAEGKIPFEEQGSNRRVPDSFNDNFLKTNFDASSMLSDYPHIPVHFYYPLIITDENRGVIRAKLDELYNIIDLEDIGSCTYSYISENANQYGNVLDIAFALPILICSFSSLPSVLDLITKGIQEISKIVQDYITQNPYLIANEFWANKKVTALE
jgi:hypothetical protein